MKHDDRMLEDALLAYFRSLSIVDSLRLRLWDERNLTTPQLRMMFILAGQDGVTPGALAERMHVTPPTITGLTDRLAKQGLISRVEDPNDRRLVRLSLTDEGRRTTNELETMGRAFLKEVLGRLPPDHVKRLTELLQEFWTAAEVVQGGRDGAGAVSASQRRGIGAGEHSASL
jgi:DNA-binding MarR family transcriptional regulator